MLLVFGGAKTKKLMRKNYTKAIIRNVKKYLLLYIYMSSLESRLYGKGEES